MKTDNINKIEKVEEKPYDADGQGLYNPETGEVVEDTMGVCDARLEADMSKPLDAALDAIDEITAEMTRTGDLSMTESAFESKMAAYDPGRGEKWMSVYSGMISRGYDPEMIYTVLEIIARICYTQKAITAGLALDETRVPRELVVIYNYINRALLANGIAADTFSMLSDLCSMDARLDIIARGIQYRVDNLKTWGKRDDRYIYKDSGDLLPLLKPFGLQLRQSITNKRAYDGWKIVDGDLAGDIAEAAASLGCKIGDGKVDKALGWAARSRKVNLQAEILDKVLHAYQYPSVDDYINGVRRDYIAEMAACIPTVESDEVKIATLRYFLQRSFQVLNNPVLQGMVLGLKGKKGCGKSTFVRWLFSCLIDENGDLLPIPQTVTDLFHSTPSPFFVDSKADFSEKGIGETQEILAERFGVELSEFALTPRDWDRFKAAITSIKQSRRRAYDKYATDLTTIAVLIATMDHISLSEPDTHRLLILTIKDGEKIDLARLVKIPAGKVWAQVAWELANGAEYAPDTAMEKAFANAQMGAVEESAAETVIMTNFHFGSPEKVNDIVPKQDLEAYVTKILSHAPQKGEIKRVLEKQGVRDDTCRHHAHPGKKVACWRGLYPTDALIAADPAFSGYAKMDLVYKNAFPDEYADDAPADPEPKDDYSDIPF